MSKYAGLTNDLDRRKAEHGNPSDWWTTSFKTETEARTWEKGMHAKPGYQGGTGGDGWRFGYTYTITNTTIE